jgi:hypothetical protein
MWWWWKVRCLDVPTLAARFIFRTLMHSATAAPELSMTLSMDWWVLAGSCGSAHGEDGIP